MAIWRSQGPVIQQPAGEDRRFCSSRHCSARIRRRFKEDGLILLSSSKLQPGEHAAQYPDRTREYVRYPTFTAAGSERSGGTCGCGGRGLGDLAIGRSDELLGQDAREDVRGPQRTKPTIGATGRLGQSCTLAPILRGQIAGEETLPARRAGSAAQTSTGGSRPSPGSGSRALTRSNARARRSAKSRCGCDRPARARPGACGTRPRRPGCRWR